MAPPECTSQIMLLICDRREADTRSRADGRPPGERHFELRSERVAWPVVVRMPNLLEASVIGSEPRRGDDAQLVNAEAAALMQRLSVSSASAAATAAALAAAGL